MKKHNTDSYTGAMALMLFFMLASGTVALCLWNYFVAIGSGVCLLVYLVLAIVAAAKFEHGASYFVLSWEILVVSIVFFVAMPVTFVMWIVEMITEAFHKSNG